MNGSISRLLGVLLLAAPEALQAQYASSTNADGSIYSYTNNPDGTITVVGYSGPPWAVSIPTNINGLTVTSIGYRAFDGFIIGISNLTSVTIPGTVTSIGEDAFEYCFGLTNATIPGSVISIGEDAFGYCASLTSVTIPGSVTGIGYAAFAGSGLTNVTIPGSVTNIGAYAFSCSNLAAINVDSQNSVYSSVAGVVFDKSGSTLLLYPQGAVGSYTIPGSVTNIARQAFWFCSGLASVTIPGTVSSIGVAAFAECHGLMNVTMASGVASIQANAFNSCTNLSGITIPGSVTNIAESAFVGCTCLTYITIPASVATLGDYLFGGCSSLGGAFFVGNAPFADTNVFNYATNVTVYYLPGATGWSNSFAGVPALLWNPLIQTADGSFGVRANQFGFNITGTPNIPILVQAADDLANPVWTSVQSLTLTNGSYYFSDPIQPATPARFYRIASQ